MVGDDPLFGPCLAVVYRTDPVNKSKRRKKSSVSTLLISQHGTSGFLNITIGPQSRYHCASLNLPEEHQNSVVRQALAITTLRSFATMDISTRENLTRLYIKDSTVDWDETMAASMAARMKLADGRYPEEIGKYLLDCGYIEPKLIKSSTIDVVYEDSDNTIDKNNEMVYLLGDQMEQLFDPLSEYSPESTELSYSPPTDSYTTLEDDSEQVRTICEELFALQANLRSELIDFLQEFLIPLRVKVLGGEISNLNIRKLNSIFPPTIDEVVRINNIFYDSLRQAYPYGSFEILKACGMTIPYFYKACMRHEAATKSFSRSFNYHYERTLGQFRANKPAATYTPRKIESIIHVSIHLTKVKLILDRLIKAKSWPKEQQVYVSEYYNSAVGTIDAFGKENTVAPYNRRIFTPTGKILVEIANGWPKELEYGWINRRVVTIFDAKDITAPEQETHHIIILFTDYLVILKPQEPIALVSASGLHKPSIADILMHALINESPLQTLPQLEVFKWNDASSIFFAEYSGSRNLAIYSSNEGFYTKNGLNKDALLYQLVRPDSSATKMVELLAKAKIMNKTQPFHLFKVTKPELSIYTPVHELEAYTQEIRKSPVAMFLNVDITREVLKANNLKACFKVAFADSNHVKITLYSVLDYEFQKTIAKSDFNSVITTELSHIYSLYLSKNQNLSINRSMVEKLIFFATSSNNSTGYVGRRRTHTPGYRHVSFKPSIEPIIQEESNVKRRGSPDDLTKTISNQSSVKKKSFKFIRVKEKSPTIEMSTSEINSLNKATADIPSASDIVKNLPEKLVDIKVNKLETPKSAPPTFEFPIRTPPTPESESELEPQQLLRTVKSFNELRSHYGNVASDDDDYTDWEDLSDSSPLEAEPQNESQVISSEVISPSSSNNSFDDFEITSESDLDEQQQQRDVSAWYNSINEEDSESLNSDLLSINDYDDCKGINDESNNSDCQRHIKKYHSIKQIGHGFGSQTFCYVHSNQESMDPKNKTISKPGFRNEWSEDITSNTVDTIRFEDDFAYLAGLVGDDGTATSNLGVIEPSASSGRLYPDLRDSSIAFLGSFVNSKSSENTGIYGDERSIALEDINELEILRNSTSPPTESEWMSLSSSRSSSNRRQAEGSINRNAQIVENEAEATHRKKLAVTSSTSFKRMLSDASSNTLQLASFTVHLDRLIDEKINSFGAENQLAIEELVRIKRDVITLYQRTRHFTMTVGIAGHLDDVQMQKQVVKEQNISAKQAACLLFTVMALMNRETVARNKPRYINIAYALLDLEWLRRNKLVDGLGDFAPRDLFGKI